MRIYGYQAEDLLREYGVGGPQGLLVTSPQEAQAAARGFGGPVVLKPQVHVQIPNETVGVRVAETAGDTEAAARAIFRARLSGTSVRKLLVVPAVTTQAEAYLSLSVDRSTSKLVFAGRARGGSGPDEAGRSAPAEMLRLAVPAVRSEAPAPGEYEPLAGRLLGGPAHAPAVARVMAAMERVFRERDCSLIEMDPLAMTRDGRIFALNARILFDDNALFRQPANLALRNGEVVDPAEVAARDEGLSFIALKGNIGCMANGAGLAMATLDTIKHLGGAPANFLDVGGSSSMRKIISGFEIILRNPRVNVIFINIFGGITRCDDVARGILLAMEENRVSVPVVIRLVGTNEQEGRALLVGRNLTVAETLEEGAQQAVEIGRAR